MGYLDCFKKALGIGALAMFANESAKIINQESLDFSIIYWAKGILIMVIICALMALGNYYWDK